jgi:enamine deaminase RidA (YjgF/YER057c/UK114 family)
MARAEQASHHFEDVEQAVGFSQTIVADNVLYISGVISVDASITVIGAGDMSKQVATIYATIGQILERHGSTLQDVVKETVFTTDIEALKGALGARNAAFTGAGAYWPASTMVEVRKLFLPEAMVEVEAVAHLRRAVSK